MYFRPLVRPLVAALLLVPLLNASAQDESVPDDEVDFAVEAAETPEIVLPEIVLPESDSGFTAAPGLRVDVNGSGSYIYDSNTAQTENGPSASLFAFAYGANVKSSAENQQGVYFGADLQGQYFVYDEVASEMGRDPHEQQFGGFMGVNGGKTRVRLDLDYRRNNGNSLAFDQIQRETRRAQSHDYTFALGVSRDFYRGTLEFGAGYTLRDFDAGTGFNDGENTYGDIAWLTTPSFAPKSSMGLGFRFGSDEYDKQSSQSFVTPSYRWRYRLSGKTSLNSMIGYQMRSTDGPGDGDSEHLVFNGGIDWAATAKTAFGLSYYRNVQPSYVENGADSTTTGLSLNMMNKLPGRFQLSSRLGYENASYFASAGNAATIRDDDFLRLALELSHPLQITEKLLGEWAIFYHYNKNDSTLAVSSFDQSVAGVRFGLVY